MSTVSLVSLIVFLQLLCIGANFSTLKFYSESLGGTGLAVGILWAALSVPRALLSPLWGSVSDRWGRKPVMVLGTLGTMAGSLLWVFADSWGMLLTSRLVDGVLSAQAAVAMSIIADCTTREKRARAMGTVGGAVVLGLTIGPAMGGLVGSMAGFPSLGWVMFGLQAAALLLTLTALRESRPRKTTAGASLIPDAFRPAAWRLLAARPGAVALIGAAGVIAGAAAVYSTAFPNASAEWFEWDESQLMWAFATLGFVGAIAQGGIVRVFARDGREPVLAGVGIVVVAIGFALMAAWKQPAPALIATAVLALGSGLAFPCLTSLLSARVDAESQGLTLGANQMAQGLGRGAGFLAGSAFGLGALHVPFLLAIGGCAMAFLFFWLAIRAETKFPFQPPPGSDQLPRGSNESY